MYSTNVDSNTYVQFGFRNNFKFPKILREILIMYVRYLRDERRSVHLEIWNLRYENRKRFFSDGNSKPEIKVLRYVTVRHPGLFCILENSVRYGTLPYLKKRVR